jgi:hypothetical protein
MVTTIEKLSVAATDLTLFFGAESYIYKCAGGHLADPEGQTCLQTLIDLVINCEKLYLTLPGDTANQPSKLFPAFQTFFRQLPDSALELTEEAEERLQRGFSRFLKAKAFQWARDWVNFQLRSPIVTAGHSLRLGRRMVSEDGWRLWQELRRTKEVQPLLRWPALISGKDLRAELVQEQRDLTPHEFALCYTFDVYRRGWQYLERVRATGENAAYFPHIIRIDALDSGAQDWAWVSYRQGVLWSWGAYICEVIHDKDYPAYRSPEGVAKLMEQVREAMVKTGCPAWDSVQVLDSTGKVLDGAKLLEIQQYVIETARTAGLPLLRRLSSPIEQTTDILAEEAVSTAIKAVEVIGGTPVWLPFKIARIVAGVLDPQRVAKVGTGTERIRRAVSSKFFRGNYEYRGLIPG